MITKIIVENYACIKRGEIELKPLTILIGDNASGKTMIINALLQLVDIIINSRFARIPLDEVVREEPDHTKISIVLSLDLLVTNIIELLVSIVFRLAVNKIISIPEPELLINNLRKIIQCYDNQAEKIIYDIITSIKNILNIYEKLSYKDRTFYLLNLRKRVSDLVLTSLMLSDKTQNTNTDIGSTVLAALLLMLNIDKHYIDEIVRYSKKVRENIMISLYFQKSSKGVKIIEGLVSLEKLKISVNVKRDFAKLTICDKSFMITNEFYESDIKRIIFDLDYVTSLILCWIYDELWSSWEPDARPKSLVFVPGFRFEPHVYVPYFEIRSRVDRFPISDLYIVQAYDKEELEKFSHELGYNSFKDLMRSYFDIDDVEIQEITDFGVKIIVRRGVLKSTIAASGSGTYYVLPIVIACSMCESDSTIIIEHPELYLNPRYQARLM
ncbi:MAG: AAA family ATPase, partial [Crenarchaeota archaeon]|nr:AAA family ATPase [Thermoproteota archaeon]